MVVSRAAARADTDALEAAGVQVIVATGENEPARVRSGLEQLGALGVTAVLLEGGPHLAGAFLDAGEIDEIRLFLAPLLLGGSAARDPLEGKGVEQISEALRALTFDCARVARTSWCRRACGSGELMGIDQRPETWDVFTGLIADLGSVRSVEHAPDGATLQIATRLASELGEGDSVAVNGVCLTATEVRDGSFAAQAMRETLERSALGGLEIGARVNLELALRAADRLGGHVVQGHVDGTGTVG